MPFCCVGSVLAEGSLEPDANCLNGEEVRSAEGGHFLVDRPEHE